MYLEKLLMHAGESLCGASVGVPMEQGSRELSELSALLSERNGFYAFESALHVRGTCRIPGEPGLVEWNAPDLWRSGYANLPKHVFFFAADAFGGQFCVVGDAVERMDPETGLREYLAASLEDWAGVILDDFEAQTGWPLMRDWQIRHGPLPRGKRLVPATPFVLGGSFAVENLRAVGSLEAMQFYADLATQLREVPDGSRVKLRLVE